MKQATSSMETHIPNTKYAHTTSARLAKRAALDAFDYWFALDREDRAAEERRIVTVWGTRSNNERM